MAKAKPAGAIRISVWEADCLAAAQDLRIARSELQQWIQEFPHTRRALERIDAALIKLGTAGAIGSNRVNTEEDE